MWRVKYRVNIFYAVFCGLALLFHSPAFSASTNEVCASAPSPRTVYIQKKQNIFSAYNDLKFIMIENGEWLDAYLNGGEFAHISLSSGAGFLQKDVTSITQSMLAFAIEMSSNQNQFHEKDAGMLSEMQAQLGQINRLRMEMEKMQSLFAAYNDGESARTAGVQSQKMLAAGKKLTALFTDIFECRNSLMPNLNSLFNAFTVTTRRSYNNILLNDIKVSADNRPDRNYILLAALGENFASLDLRSRGLLDVISSHYQAGNFNKGDRELKRMLQDLRRGKGVFGANMLVNYIVRRLFSFEISEDNFEILRTKDLFDRIKAKKDYLANLQEMLVKCQKNAGACSREEHQSLEAEFKNHRESLVTLYARFQDQYLKMFQMYEGHNNLVNEYLRIHTVIKKRIMIFSLW